MFTKLYNFSGPEQSHLIIHLLEHLIIQSFLSRLQAIGQDAVLFGLLQSKTIDNRLFIRFSAYSRQVASLFQEHIANLPSFDIEQITQSLTQIGVETKTIVTINDRSLLYKQLAYLSRSLKNGIEIDTAPGHALAVRRDTHQYRDSQLVVSAKELTLKERELFIIFHPLITDVIRWGTVESVQAYPAGAPTLASLPQEMIFSWPLTLSHTVDDEALASSITLQLRNFKAAWYEKQIKAYAAMVSSNEYLADRTARYYEQTGIMIEPETVAHRLTPQNLQLVVDALTVRIKY